MGENAQLAWWQAGRDRDAEAAEQGQPEPAACGYDNENLVVAGYRFDACHREPGHPGQHEYRSL